MKMRLFSQAFGLGTALVVVGLAGWACSAPDPGELGNRDPGPGDNNPPPRNDAGPSNGGNDAGGNGGTDAGPPNGPFVGAPDYVNTPGVATLRPGHDVNGAGQNPAGRNCTGAGGCHGAGGSGPPMLIGGTIYRDATGAATVGAGVEVRLRSPDGAFVKGASTDENGNFFVLGSDPLPAGTLVGVRAGSAAANTKLMGGVVTGSGDNGGGSCQHAGGCHGTGQAKIWVTVP